MSLVDFDTKIAAALFTAGCNLRCPFCHNSGLVNCEDNLTAQTASNINGDNISEESVLSFLKKRKGLLDAVCISGGEPTLQNDLIPFIKKIKAEGFAVKLDTNGTNPDVLQKLISANLIDYAAMDIKNSPEKYSVTAGTDVDLESILKSVKILLEGNIEYEFRTTVISEFHTREDIEKIGELVCGANKFFLQRYVDNDNCIAHGFSEVPKEEAEIFRSVLCEYVKSVALRGY